VTFDPPDRLLGVDVSVAAGSAGDGTWIADGRAAGDRLRIDSLSPAAALAGGPRARPETLDALVGLVRSLDGDAAVALDFPFGVPVELLDGGPDPAAGPAAAGPDGSDGSDGADDHAGPVGPADWPAFVSGFRDRFPGPDAFAEACVARTRAVAPDRTYLRRATDERVGARSPYGFVVDTLAYHGIASVLARLVDDDGIRVVPIEPPAADATLVLETYPAATFDRLGLARDRYKGADAPERDRRERNVAGLCEPGPDGTDGLIVTGDRRATAAADADGDAADALAAARAAFAATRSREALAVDDPRAAVEGWIYA